MLAAYALLTGAFLSACIIWAVLFVRSSRQRYATLINPQVPEIAVALLDSLETPAYIIDSAMRPVYSNAAAAADLRRQTEFLKNTQFLRAMRDVMQNAKPYLWVPETDSAHSSYRVRALRLTPGFVAVLVTDLSAEKRLTAIRRDFIANVSHELKTPAAAMSLLAEAIITAKNEPEIVAQFAQDILTEAERLGALTRDIINLSQAQAELLPQELTQLSIWELIAAEVTAHTNYAAQHKIELVLTEPSPKQLQATVLGQHTLLSRAVANLLTNAINYSPAGSSVGIGLEINKNKAEITVTDNGPGIAPELQERIFERFFRADTARTRSTGGTGLGLAIVRHTMRSHGGKVTLWSQPGQGSTFTLQLPLIADNPKAVKNKHKKPKRKVKLRER